MKTIILITFSLLINSLAYCQNTEIVDVQSFKNQVFWGAFPNDRKDDLVKLYQQYNITFSENDGELVIHTLRQPPLNIDLVMIRFDNNVVDHVQSAFDLSNINLNNNQEIIIKYDSIVAIVSKIFGKPKYFADQIRNQNNDNSYAAEYNWAKLSSSWLTSVGKINIIYDSSLPLMAISIERSKQENKSNDNKVTQGNLEGVIGCKWGMTPNEVRKILVDTKNAEENEVDNKNTLFFKDFKLNGRDVAQSWFIFVDNKLYRIQFQFEPKVYPPQMSQSFALYNEIVNEVKGKYGSPSFISDKFKNENSRSDNNLALKELSVGTAKISSKWLFTDNNSLAIYLGEWGVTVLEYQNKQLGEKAKAEQEY